MMCLVIDELDPGIYEYLLGELLSVFEKSARGQLIFTSHNLRDLYLRSITLGGQKEDVYAETDSVEIGRAFRRAEKAVRENISK